MADPRITVKPIPMPTPPPRRHVDAFAEGPAAPRPKSRDANPGLSERLGQGAHVIPEGAQLEITHTPARGAAVTKTILGAGMVQLRQNNAPRVKPRNRYEPGT